MKASLKTILIFLAFISIQTIKAQTGNCNLVSSFTAVDTSFCETIFYPSVFDNNYNYNWDFGDGNSSNSPYTVNQYNSPGTYIVTLIVSDSVCADTVVQNVVVAPCNMPCNLFASFTKFDSACYTGFQPSPYDTSFTFYWDFGDGNTSTDLEPLHLYNSIGTYTVTLIVSNGSCSDTVISQINSTNCASPCNSPIDFYDYDSACYTGFYPTPLNSSYSYHWDFGDGNTSTLMNPEHLYASQGNYNVTLIISDGNCLDTITKNISSASCNSPCTISADFYDYDTSCYTGFYPSPINASYSYFWDFGDGNTSTLMNPEHLYASQGNYNVTLIISDGNCLDTITKNISSASCNSPCNLDASFTVSGSGTNTFTFTPNTILSANNYFWIFGDGSTSNNTIATHTYSTASTFAVMLMVSDSLCSDIDTLFIDVLDSNAYNLNSSFTYSQENNGSFTFIPNNEVTTYDSFIWDFGDSTISTLLSPNHTFPTDGVYTVSFTVTNGVFTHSDTLNLVVNTLGVHINEIAGFNAKLYPNPASEIANFEFLTEKSEVLEILIIDLNGKVLINEIFTSNKGQNKIELNINSLSKGAYQLVLRQKNNNTPVRIRLIKQ